MKAERENIKRDDSLLSMIQLLEQGFKIKREPAKALDDIILCKLKKVGAKDIQEVEEALKNNYSEKIIVRAFDLLEEDSTGDKLRVYLKKEGLL